MVKSKKIIRKKTKFYCPESPYILWHHNLIFAECPVLEGDRTMAECEKCPLFGKSEFKGRKSKKKKKNIPKLERRGKGPIPKIGKTYTGDDNK